MYLVQAHVVLVLVLIHYLCLGLSPKRNCFGNAMRLPSLFPKWQLLKSTLLYCAGVNVYIKVWPPTLFFWSCQRPRRRECAILKFEIMFRKNCVRLWPKLWWECIAMKSERCNYNIRMNLKTVAPCVMLSRSWNGQVRFQASIYKYIYIYGIAFLLIYNLQTISTGSNTRSIIVAKICREKKTKYMCSTKTTRPLSHSWFGLTKLCFIQKHIKIYCVLFFATRSKWTIMEIRST